MEISRNKKTSIRRVSRSKKRRIKLVRKYGEKCFYCGGEGELTIDHVVPISKGGKANQGNLRLSCKKCNVSKGSLSAEEFEIKRIKEKYVRYAKVSSRHKIEVSVKRKKKIIIEDSANETP